MRFQNFAEKVQTQIIYLIKFASQIYLFYRDKISKDNISHYQDLLSWCQAFVMMKCFLCQNGVEDSDYSSMLFQLGYQNETLVLSEFVQFLIIYSCKSKVKVSSVQNIFNNLSFTFVKCSPIITAAFS